MVEIDIISEYVRKIYEYLYAIEDELAYMRVLDGQQDKESDNLGARDNK